MTLLRMFTRVKLATHHTRLISQARGQI